jgi:hypothetical protein
MWRPHPQWQPAAWEKAHVCLFPFPCHPKPASRPYSLNPVPRQREIDLDSSQSSLHGLCVRAPNPPIWHVCPLSMKPSYIVEANLLRADIFGCAFEPHQRWSF